MHGNRLARPALLLLAITACGDDGPTFTTMFGATDTSTGTDTGTSSATSAATTSTTTSASTTSTSSTSSATATETGSGSTTGSTGSTSGEPTTSGVDTSTTATGSTTGVDTTTGDTSTGGVVDSDLCVHLGGVDGIHELHLGFLGKVLVDTRINAYFLNAAVDPDALALCLDEQIAEAAGCAGAVYGCLDMKSAHQGMGISTVDFGDLVEDYGLALVDHKANHPDLSDADVMTVVDALNAMSADIVEDPANDLTVYQRVGRKPEIQAMIGAIGDAGSLIDNIAKDFTINGFFLNADFERLRTCFTRQIAGLDGPAVYGAEVDSPGPGVDPGVALADPCAAMKAGHAGLVDDKNSPITYDDFVSLMSDLASAMNSAGFGAVESAAILSAFEPLCVDVVADPNSCPGNSQTVLVKKTKAALDIPNDAYDGSLGTMACVSLTVIDDGINFVGQVAGVTLGIEHAGVGDLVVKVQSPSGKVSTLMSRPGLAEAADDGAGCCGDASSLSKSFPVTFFDGGLVDAEAMGIGNVVCQDDGFCEYSPNPDKGPGVDLGDFVGEVSKGTWKVCVGDGEPGATGYVDAVTLVLDKVKFKP